MTTLDERYQNDNRFQEWERNHRKGRIVGGILLITAGVLFWFDKAGLLDIPRWLFSWQTFLIGIGIISGIKHNFKNSAWLVLVGIGTLFLLAELIPGLHLRFYTFPAILIIIGAVLIFKPKNRYHYYQRYQYRKGGKWNQDTNPDHSVFNSTDEYLNINNVFGGVKKRVVSKDFKGGDINTTFGGTDVDLMQSDIQSEAIIDLSVTFGGVKLLVPAHWRIKSDITTVMGGLEDKRPVPANTGLLNEKVIVLKGNVFFGGVEIKSY